ncbi:MAG: pyridoxamine 5'-phosphate oxidase [Verrucomicrobia bacterium]|nr:pyridoxamine 5'-phosphate oxidase [Verrucomicrobiota bacterium]
MNDESSLHSLRRDYDRNPLQESDLDPDPVQQFRVWFNDARASGIAEPNAMTLGTADAAGHVSCRMVLLKAYDDRGFVFFTNYGSRKGRQIAENPHASLLFPWVALARQVEIAGRVEKISVAQSVAYFINRPFGSRLGAWVSDQSEIIPSRQILLTKFEELKRKFAHGEIPKPDDWGGYRIVPDSIEFWQGGHDRLHDRFLYARTGEAWKISRLSP